MAAAAGVVLGVIWMAPGLGFGVPLVLPQTGDSMAVGWWRYDHAAPARVGEVVVERDPPDFKVPWLMKRVVGTAGSVYCWRADIGTHTLDGQRLPAPHPTALALGLRPWTGCRALERGEVVGYGDSLDSYDSRYRGVVRESDLWGVYRPLWVTPER